MQNQTEVLCVRDRTDLKFPDHGECQGMGLISKNKASSGTLGIHLYSMLVLDVQGVPLGVPHIEYSSIADDKMQRWSCGLRECSTMGGKLEGVGLVSVMNREGDCFDLFAERRRLGNVELLVRAGYNRSLGKGVSKQKARVAQVALRWREVQLPIPSDNGSKDRRPMSLNLMHVQEIDAPLGVQSIEWFC